MRSIQRSFPVFLLIFSAAGGMAHGSPRVRDVWHAYIADGHRFGSIHTVVIRLPDKNFRISRDSRILIDLLGVNKEEIIERGEYVVTPDYRPVSIAVEGKRESGKTRVTGRIRGSIFEVTATVAGIDRSRVFDDAETVLLEPCLDDWLADRPEGYESGTITLLGEESCTPKPTQVRRLASRPGDIGRSWSVNSGPLEGDRRFVLDSEGLLMEQSDEGGLKTIRRCSADQARDIVYRTMNGRDVLMFPIGTEIGPPELLESLTVELKWKDIDFNRFRLEDDRQHIVEQSRQGDQYRALVRIDAPKPMTAKPRLPIGGPEFAPYLGESRFIKPKDERIVAVAREVTKGKTDALEAVRALSSWVSRNVEAAMIAETLTGPEVLACRKGKCSEYSTLFASLARAVGIPTRIALGERMIPGQWGGHMWNEVYVGRWIPVDSSVDEVGTSFALVKLIDHQTVEGTQPLRRALPASLGIEIKDHRSKRSSLSDKFKTGIVGRIYTNAELGCRMTAPGDDWSIEEVKQLGATVLRFKVPEKGKVDIQLHFVAFALPVPLEPRQLLALRRKHYEKNLKEFKVIADEPHPVKTLAGHRLEFRMIAGEGKSRRGYEVIWRKSASGYLLTLNAEEPGFEEGKAFFDALIQTFEDLDQK